MRAVYKVLAYVIAVEVAVQATLVVFGMAGLSRWISEGGVLDKAVMESEDEFPFAEVLGFILHGINGGMVIPALALLLLISSFFAKARGASKWAGLVLLLVVVQVNLGFLASEMPAVGALHGLNALALFTVALHTARRSRAGSPVLAAAVTEPAEATAAG